MTRDPADIMHSVCGELLRLERLIDALPTKLRRESDALILREYLYRAYERASALADLLEGSGQ